nr:substrate-binding domain-containing protein [Streptomyces sp. MBT56]
MEVRPPTRSPGRGVRPSERPGGDAYPARTARRGAGPDGEHVAEAEDGVGAQRALYEAGLDIPGDVAVAGVDGSAEGLYSTPSLTSVVPDQASIAAMAVSCLVTRIGSEDPLPYEVRTAPHRLAVRESTDGVRRPLPT